MLAVADAALGIGDPALEHEGDVASLDLGEEWTRLTGLPFVYAFWAGRPGAVDGERGGGSGGCRRALAAGMGATTQRSRFRQAGGDGGARGEVRGLPAREHRLSAGCRGTGGTARVLSARSRAVPRCRRSRS